MPPRRKLLISVLFLVILAAVLLAGLLLYRRSQQPPELARLLPEGDLILYANVKPAHLSEMTQSQPAHVEGEYQNFIDQTGIQLERDLDEVAMSRRPTADAKDTESVEVLAGRFDSAKLTAFLEKLAAQKDSFHGRIIYVIPHEGHTVRVSILDAKRVAITNMASSDQIHEIIDGTDKLPDGPSLLQAYYKHVPVASLGWVILRTGSVSQLPNGYSFDFLDNTVTVGSVRYAGDLLVRADVVAPSDNDARRVVDSAGGFLSMYRTVEKAVTPHGTDADIKSAIDSVQVQQNKNVAVFTATLPQRILKKLVSEASQAAAPAASPSPPPSPEHRRRHRRHKPTASPTPPAG